jgi:hypothetical protein
MADKEDSVEYTIMAPEDPKAMGRVLIKTSRYAGMTVAFGDLQFQEFPEPKIKYVYEVFDNPLGIEHKNDEKFRNILDGILHDVLTKAFCTNE